MYNNKEQISYQPESYFDSLSSLRGFIKNLELELLQLRGSNHRFRERINPILFRGQGNSGWKLQTKLERTVEINSLNYDLNEYFANLPDFFGDSELSYEDYEESGYFYNPSIFNVEKVGNLLTNGALIKSLSYLRQHEVATPILDWSHDLNIALYWACSQFNGAESENIAIFTLIEQVNSAFTYNYKTPRIWVTGGYDLNEARAMRQNANYTISALVKDNKLCFVPYPECGEKTLVLNKTTTNFILKLILPGCLCEEILVELEALGISEKNIKP